MLSVTDFTSGSSKFIIGNEDIVREYTFIGETQVTDVTTDDYINTNGGFYFLLNSARDEREYYIWLDRGLGAGDPGLSNKIGIRARIFSGDTASDVASRTEAAILAATDDFDISTIGSVMTITNIKNGNTTDASVVGLGGVWAASTTTQGDGEDAGSNEVLLSSLASIGQSIDETARSLVRVINKDSSSPVNTFYLSGPDDLPGIILFENRSLNDKSFNIGTNDNAIKNKFNPSLESTQTITAISAANPTQITSTAHGLTTGDNIFIYGTDSTPTIQNKYEITFVDVNNFTVPVDITIAGTTGTFFKATVESDNEESPNRLFYSKINQAEAVPIVNFLDIGPKDQPIRRIIALRDNLFVLKDDGVYIVTGTSAPNFGSRLLDGSVQTFAADTPSVLNNKIYALTSEGVVTITESGVSLISRNIEDKILEFMNSRHAFKTVSFGFSSDSDRSYFLWAPSDVNDVIATQCYRYNSFTRTWTRWTVEATCGVVDTSEDMIYLGAGDRNFTIKERKNLDKTDYADRSFLLDILTDGVSGKELKISTAVNTEIGDVILQNQYVTLSQVNRLLKKLDIDVGLDDTDYFSTLEIIPGDNMKFKLDLLNSKLLADDSSGIVTARIFSIDFLTQQTQYNDLINELNNTSCDTFFKNFKESEGITPYESTVTFVDTLNSEVLVSFELPYLFGAITSLRSISSDILWSPQHFGASDILKQIREGTIMFDQNNFLSASVGYSSDLSQNFEFIAFDGRGDGSWGNFTWGENTWGGQGSEVPLRTLIPQQKQRCRHLRVRFKHSNGRETYRILGISLEPRVMSKRAYR
jgi:hypothetical protein